MKKRFLFMTMLFTLCLCAAACGKKNTEEADEEIVEEESTDFDIIIGYTVDGEAIDGAPNYAKYDYVSITGGEEAGAYWDEEDCTVYCTGTSKKDITVIVDFTPTVYPIKMHNKGYTDLQDAFDDATIGTVEDIFLWQDYEGSAIVPSDAKIVLYLNGNTIDGVGNDTLTVRGTLTVYGEGSLVNTVENESELSSKTIANYGNLTLDGVTLTNSTSSVTLWNSSNNYSVVNLYDCDITHNLNESNVMINSGTMNIYSGIYHAVSGEGYSVLKINYADAVVNYYDGTFVNYAEGFTVTLLDGTFNNLSPNDLTGTNKLGSAAYADKSDDSEDEEE